jgi:hypothetical protein
MSNELLTRNDDSAETGATSARIKATFLMESILIFQIDWLCEFV